MNIPCSKSFMKHPSFSGGGCRGMHEQRIGGDFIPVISQAGLAAWQRPGRFILKSSTLFTLINSKSLAISGVTKAIKRNRKQLQSFVIVFRDHKKENKRKEMFHHCHMFAI